MLARLHRLVAQAGVTVEMRAPRGIHFLRHVTQDERDLSFYIDAVVGVVTRAVTFRHGQSIAGENDLAFRLAVFSEGERSKILVERDLRRRLPVGCDFQAGFLREDTLPGIKLKREEEILA